MGHYNNLYGEWWLYIVHCTLYKLEIQESVGGEIDGWWERVLLKRAGAKPSKPETPDAGSGLVLMMLMRKKWEIMTFVMTMLTMMFTRMISMVDDMFLSPGSSQKLTSRDLTQFAHHVARGMDYLSSKKVKSFNLSFNELLLVQKGQIKFHQISKK